MGVLADLAASGRVGPDTYSMLCEVAGRVVRSHSFPPPASYTSWTDEAVADLLADLFSTKGMSVLTQWVASATDDASLKRLVYKSIKNHLIDQAKATEVGKLRRRLDTLLSADDRFEATNVAGGHAWTLKGSVGTWQGDLGDLVAAAARVSRVHIASLPPSGPTPRAAKEVLLRVAHAVLAEADGAVRDQDLARVVQYRVAYLHPIREVSLEEVVPGGDLDPYEAVDGRLEAREIVEALPPDDAQLLVLLLNEATTEDICAQLSCGPGEARARIAGLREKVEYLLRDKTLDEEQSRELGRLSGEDGI